MGDLEQGKNTGLVFFWDLLCFQEVSRTKTKTICYTEIIQSSWFTEDTCEHKQQRIVL